MIAIGFIMPRLINDELGQAQLGIWDFCWSIVNYISLAELGMGSSVSRFVAVAVTKDDRVMLCETINSIFFSQIFLMAAAGAIAYAALFIGHDRLLAAMPENTSGTLGVLAILSIGVVYQLICSSSRGVMNGLHRWDITNIINTAGRVVSSIAMIVALYVGGDLQSIAIAYLISTIAAETIRFVYALRLAEGLTIHPQYFKVRTALKMAKFGLGQFLFEGLPVFFIQAFNIVIMGLLGPASLAIFSRTFALVKYIEMFVSRFTRIIVPSVASLSTSKESKEVQDLFLKCTKFSLAITIPSMLLNCLIGPTLIKLWMGENYVNLSLIYTLSLGYILPVSMSTSMNVLIGLNKHIFPTVVNAVILGAGIGAGILFNNDPTTASLSLVSVYVSATLIVSYGIFTPILCSKALQIPASRLIGSAFRMPLLCNIPLIAFTIYAHDLTRPDAMHFAWFAGAMCLTIWLYWVHIFPQKVKAKLYKLRAQKS
ncbi:MAG: oligosaccharide flippase family protein [Gammaproteobacteria bacterium]|nr:oligosaccharide flippase family protein [Gammaproteobacteria bacterium]